MTRLALGLATQLAPSREPPLPAPGAMSPQERGRHRDLVAAHGAGVALDLRGLRRRAGTAQQEVAERLGVSRFAIAHIESRGPRLLVPTLAGYVQALDCRLLIVAELPDGSRWLLSGEGAMVSTR